MKTIWKSQLPLADVVEIEVPAGSKILAIQVQNNLPCIWYSFEVNQAMVKRKLRIVGTGNIFEQRGPHVGTFQLGNYVFHVFEEH